MCLLTMEIISGNISGVYQCSSQSKQTDIVKTEEGIQMISDLYLQVD